MNLPLIFRTVAHLKPMQIACQIKKRVLKPRYKQLACEGETGGCRFAPFVPKPTCHTDGTFRFLNLESAFTSWNDTSHGNLWAYNLNYMDWLMQEGMSEEEGCRWIDKFSDNLTHNKIVIGLDPYATALRCINWIKFLTVHDIPASRRKRWDNSLYSQVRLLEKKLEFHLLGNHLLEDAYALFISSIYFSDKRMHAKASRLLLKELRTQTLPDGAHYEQSPMYHCILLDRLLDCYNFSSLNEIFPGQAAVTDKLRHYCRLMLGHLESIVWNDDTFPLFNDAALGIAPTPASLRAYARRLGIEWTAIPLGECGYRKLECGKMELFVDAGNITATEQPGHTHADTLTYDFRINGKPVVADTGISTYDKTPRRLYERGTMAHNTVSVGGRNSSEVWSGFRVGCRAKVRISTDTPHCVEAAHDGFRTPCRRAFRLDGERLVVADEIDTEAVSRIHLWHEEKVESATDSEILTTHARIRIENALRIEIEDAKISTEYNTFLPTKVINIHFKGKTRYTISIR